jgi:hypothetical protein
MDEMLHGFCDFRKPGQDASLVMSLSSAEMSPAWWVTMPFSSGPAMTGVCSFFPSLFVASRRVTRYLIGGLDFY